MCLKKATSHKLSVWPSFTGLTHFKYSFSISFNFFNQTLGICVSHLGFIQGWTREWDNWVNHFQAAWSTGSPWAAPEALCTSQHVRIPYLQDWQLHPSQPSGAAGDVFLWNCVLSGGSCQSGASPSSRGCVAVEDSSLVKLAGVQRAALWDPPHGLVRVFF